MIMARAYLENENNDNVLRILNWMYDQSPDTGTWLESICYGYRPSPPMPPLGVIPWAWAEIITFFVHHLLGVRPEKDELIIRPKLLNLTDKIEATIRLRNHFVSLKITRQDERKSRYAVVNQKPMEFTRQLNLPYIDENYFVEIYI